MDSFPSDAVGKARLFLRAAPAHAIGNYDPNAVSDETGVDCSEDPGYTQQQFKEECDINEIVRRFGLTGELPENLAMPVSGDFTGIGDFASAMELIRRAEEEFMSVPAELRARFENDPGRLIAFLEDGNNREEAIKLGLVKPPPEKTRNAVDAIDELAAKMVPPK